MSSAVGMQQQGIRCGVVLAAGDGTRLEPAVRQLLGYPLPKQYVNFVGTRSMLEQTFDRVQRLIPPDRLFTVVDAGHLRFAEAVEQLLRRPRGTVVLQPANRGTGPGILLPLLHLHRRYPESTVVVFPSDHFILEEELFMGHVDLACRAVDRGHFKLVLLGMEPSEPEPEYGYILPRPQAPPSAIRAVSRFIEKPPLHLAETLTRRGGLWNTLVMAFKTQTLFEAIRAVSPPLSRYLRRMSGAVGTVREAELSNDVYGEMESVNFSTGVLELLSSKDPSYLGVLTVRGVSWSDWGSAKRTTRVLQQHRSPEQWGAAERALVGLSPG